MVSGDFHIIINMFSKVTHSDNRILFLKGLSELDKVYFILHEVGVQLFSSIPQRILHMDPLTYLTFQLHLGKVL